MGASLLARAVQNAGGAEEFAKRFTPEEIAALLRTWDAVARPEQRVSATKPKTLWLAGRGFGKSFSISGVVHQWVESGRYGRIHIVAPTSADARDVIVEGPSGVMAWSPPNRAPPQYRPSKRRITFWNGARAFLFSAEEPERLRGPQCHATACDEFAAWRYVRQCWEQILMTTRLGDDPKIAIATTPRPIPELKNLLKDPTIHVVRGSTYDNKANLAPAFITEMRARFDGTRLGRQEINAEVLDDNPNALWRLADIDAKRIMPNIDGSTPELPRPIRIAVGVDPHVSEGDDTEEAEHDETGIIVAYSAKCRCKGGELEEVHAFVVADYSNRESPAKWAAAVGNAYERHDADRVIAEVNQGGALVTATLRAYGGVKNMSVRTVRAKTSKRIRAEPIAALCEQGKVHHVGNLSRLEDQLTQWDPVTWKDSPDRLDAYVYVLTDLMLGSAPTAYTPRPAGMWKPRI